jgi:hypothetical protein
MHQVKPPPYFNFRDDSLHLCQWSTLRSCKDPPFSLLPWLGTNYIPQCGSRCLCFHCKKHKVSCFSWTNPFPSTTFLSIFLLTGWHYVINWWHLHLGWCGHCQPHLNRSGFSNYFISWAGRNNGDSSKGLSLSQLAPYKHIFSPCQKGFCVLTPTSEWLSSLMC